jgi:tRNA (cytidine/uridine-2'-O-)-methyltransferase
LTVHDDTATFLKAADQAGGGRWLFSTKGTLPLWDADFRDGDWLLFGSETHGLDDALLADHPDRVVRIPQSADERCLNLSSAAAVGLYEALRRIRR